MDFQRLFTQQNYYRKNNFNEILGELYPCIFFDGLIKVLTIIFPWITLAKWLVLQIEICQWRVPSQNKYRKQEAVINFVLVNIVFNFVPFFLFAFNDMFRWVCKYFISIPVNIKRRGFNLKIIAKVLFAPWQIILPLKTLSSEKLFLTRSWMFRAIIFPLINSWLIFKWTVIKKQFFKYVSLSKKEYWLIDRQNY